jgi:DDE domain
LLLSSLASCLRKPVALAAMASRACFGGYERSISLWKLDGNLNEVAFHVHGSYPDYDPIAIPEPRVINSDKHAAYPSAIAVLQAAGDLADNCQHRPVQYLSNVLEQDHLAIKRRINASQHFRSFWCAWRTIAGYEAIHMIRKGQAYGSAAGAKVGLVHRFILGLFAATN